MLYVKKNDGAKIRMTLVPPFAPADGVGAPPERASLPVSRTRIPLILDNTVGKGRVVSCFFGLSGLIRQIGLEDWKILFENCLSYLADGKGEAEARELPEGVFFLSLQDTGGVSGSSGKWNRRETAAELSALSWALLWAESGTKRCGKRGLRPGGH